ncbi:MAG TPA: hypothetical protein VGM32_15180 [Rhodopila sp.]|jgi:hypothetical protein
MNNRLLALAFVVSVIFASGGAAYAGDDDDTISSSLAQQGFAISPVPAEKLNLAGKRNAAVGLGSYLVNAVGDCSGCHSFPRFLEKGNTSGSNPSAGDPFEGVPSTQGISQQLLANFNVSHYLAGGQCFGPFMARNLTPDANGLPQGLTEEEFIKVIRTGEDIHCEKAPTDPVCAIGPDTPVLQVMPWPTYHSMTDTQIRAIYSYLTALPSADACNTVADGCPGFSGAAAQSANYAYPNTGDCPNPPPPQ